MRAVARPTGSFTLWTLVTGNGLLWLGVGFFLPFLPLLIGSRGGGAELVGLFFAARLSGRVLAQYPGGWISDRWGSRRIVVGSLTLFALCFPLYLLPMSPLALLPLGFVQSLIGGIYEPAAKSIVAELSTAERRGRSYGRLQASSEAGLLLGPAIGGLVARLDVSFVFVAATAVCLVAALPLLRLPSAPTAGRMVSAPTVPLSRVVGPVLPLVVFAAPVTWMFAMFNTVSTLYLRSLGADPRLVGVYFAAFSAPVVLLAVVWPGLPDQLGFARAAVLALLSLAAAGLLYPVLTNVLALVGLSFAEGVVSMPILAALGAEISRRAPPGAQGRAQAVSSFSVLSVQAAGSVVCGFLYEARPVLAFWSMTGVCLIGLIGGLALNRPARERLEQS